MGRTSDKKSLQVVTRIDSTCAEMVKQMRSAMVTADERKMRVQSQESYAEYDLYLFNTQAKRLRLAFTRIQQGDFPVRLITRNGS